MNKLRKLARLISQAINALVFDGDAEEPLSARRYREGKPHTIDKWFGEGHCLRVWTAQRLREDNRRIAKF
jgi:hypothetical protein